MYFLQGRGNMSRPKKIRKSKNCSGVSTFPHYREGFNECKKLYDTHIPNEQEIWVLLLNNGFDEDEAKGIAKIVSRRLK